MDAMDVERNFSSYFEPFKPVLDAGVENVTVVVGYDGVVEHYDNVTVLKTPIFDGDSLTVVIVYCVMFVVAAVGNLTVFITLFRSRRRKSRISLMITHLAIADLMVTFVTIPFEVGWRITVKWMAGNFACKVFLFLRPLGLYLSSNVLVCVSLDRYFAVLHPLRVTDARRRGRMMLACAWGVSFVCSFPQSLVFHVSQHPTSPEFEQCVSFDFFTTRAQEIAYNLFCVSAMYFIPLLVISVAYTCILCEISKKSRENKDLSFRSKGSRLRLRRSDIRNIERARSRTLRMTITIVNVFVWCWMPYAVMTLWYMFDRESAMKVDNRLQDYFFLMAVSNSCMNPLVYGSYAMNFRRECARCCGWLAPRALDRKSTVSPPVLCVAGTGVVAGGLTTRIVRCATTLGKVGSGVTRSTGTCNNHRVEGSGINGQKQVRIQVRPTNIDHVSMQSEPSHISCRQSFHSEPNPHSEDYQRCSAELSRTLATQGLLTTRSLDDTMSIGYRKYGNQTRWR